MASLFTRSTMTVLAALLTPAPAVAQDPAPPKVVTDAPEITVGGRVHTQFNTTSVESEPTGEFLLRRVRIELGVKVNDRVSGRLQTEFAGERASVRDAYLELAFSPALHVMAGKAYRPFSLIEMYSSNRMLPIERGVRIRGVTARDLFAAGNQLQYSDRDVGFHLLGAIPGAPGAATYHVAVLRGPLHGSLGREDSYQFAARTTVRLAKAVRLGAAWSRRDFARAAAADTTVAAGDGFEVDVQYGTAAPGLHLIGELSRLDVDPFRDARVWGGQGWLGYRTRPVSRSVTGIEPLLRVSHADHDEDASGRRVGGTLLTPGINVYFGPLNRFMVNYDVWFAEEGRRASSFRTQFQLAF